MKKVCAAILSAALLASAFAGCSSGNTSSTSSSTTGSSSSPAASSSAAPSDGGAKQDISLWFWGAPPAHQEAMQKILADTYNQSQDKYQLKLEFRNTVDKDISVALSAGQGPDIVYGSGPAFIMPLVEAGKLENLDKYSEQYKWKDRILDPIYESGTVNGSLYGLGNSLNTVGVFYNKEVMKENNWELPKTVADMEKIMDEAIAKGMYASVTGNKGWKPVNGNYSSLFLNHFAGTDVVYKCLKGEEKWNNPDMVAAVNKSAEWYKKGYLGGQDYVNLNFDESVQLLADKRSPFFIGPSLVFQFASTYFDGDKADNLGFMPFPSTDKVASPNYMLGVTATLSINANSKMKDECAVILDKMMSNDFMVEMTKVWPGYWGVPLKQMDIKMDEMKGLSKTYCGVLQDASNAINSGNFGFYSSVFFPAATDTALVDIETVWNDQSTAEELLDKTDTEFKKEFDKGLVPPIPQPGK